MGAAISWYAVFSIAPLLIIVIAVAGFKWAFAGLCRTALRQQPGFFCELFHVLFAMIFKLMPQAQVSWRDVHEGSITAFMALRLLLKRSARKQGHGGSRA